jgi:hypothetical protein
MKSYCAVAMLERRVLFVARQSMDAGGDFRVV